MALTTSAATAPHASSSAAATLKSARSREAIASLLGVTDKQLRFVLYSGKYTRYRDFEIAKRGGGTRQISAPSGFLKTLQRRLKEVLHEFYRPPLSAHGFCPERSIATNASMHVMKRSVLNVDLEDFFPTIHFGRVWGVFRKPPFDLEREPATVLAQLCCDDTGLPQGAPTSPVLANLVCRRLDREFQRFARRHRCLYTRYADDITLSTWIRRFPPAVVRRNQDGEPVPGTELTAIVQSNGFEINDSKTRIQGIGTSQRVTGLVVNARVNVPRSFVRQIRAMLHAWKLDGPTRALDDHIRKHGPTSARTFEAVLRGKLAYLAMVRGKHDIIYQKLKYRLDELVSPGSGTKPREDSFTSRLVSSMWVVETSDNDPTAEASQGTAFALDGVGLVTCAHVLSGEMEAYQPSAPARRYKVAVVASDAVVDLAIIDIGQPLQASLPSTGGSVQVTRFQEVTLAGYPNHEAGKKAHIEHGHVVGFQTRHAIQRFHTSCRVVYGNSGGPVLDAGGRVIGVAVTGVPTAAESHATDSHGVLPLGALSHLSPPGVGGSP